MRAPSLDQIRDGSKTLKPGHQGEAVLEVKQLFNQIGANNPRYVPLVENENFDQELLRKVSRFQGNHPEIFSRQNHGNVTRGTLRALEAAAHGRESVATDPIPPDEPVSNTGFWYEIQKGDALDRVARRFKLDSHLDLTAEDRNKELRKNPHDIAIGQKVWIPVDAPAADAGATEVSDTLAKPPRDTTGAVIRPGDSNPLVETVRAILRQLGYKGPLPGAGNDYDNSTEVGIRWYQANFDSYRGRVDGIIAQRVWDGFRSELGTSPEHKLADLLNAPHAVTPAPAPPIESGVRTSVRTQLSRQDTVHVPANPMFPEGDRAYPVNVPGESYATTVELPPLRRQITRGKRGFDVEMAQRVLNLLGAEPPLGVDASAGGKLQAAVIAFQRKHNLESQNGVISPETWAKFAQELANQPTTRSDITFTVESADLSDPRSLNALRTLQILGIEDPARARELARYAGVTPGDPFVVDRNLIAKVVALGQRAGMPLDTRSGSYESARVFMTHLDNTSGGINTRSFDRTRYDAMIIEAAERHSVDPALVKAIMKSESNFNQTRRGSTLKSPAGALGLMQLMPGTARSMGVNPHDAAGNIDGGVKYLARQLRKYDGDILKVAAAYNAGPGAVDKYNGVPPYKETMGYVRKVQAAYEYYKATSQP